MAQIEAETAHPPIRVAGGGQLENVAALHAQQGQRPAQRSAPSPTV
jgi:hypothetical protein